MQVTQIPAFIIHLCFFLLYLLLGELPVVIEVHLLEGLMRPRSISDLKHLDDEGQRALRWDLT